MVDTLIIHTFILMRIVMVLNPKQPDGLKPTYYIQKYDIAEPEYLTEKLRIKLV